MNNLSLWLHIIKMKLSSRMSYRFDFVSSMAAGFIWQMLAPLFIAVVFYAGGKFPGWGFYEILLLQGMLMTIKGFSFMTFFGILWNTMEKIKHGNFDFVLLRPKNPLWTLILDSFDEEDSGQLFGGLVILGTAIYHLNTQISMWIIPLFILGIIFLFSIALLSSALGIVFIQTSKVYEFIDLIFVFASYPKTIFSNGLQVAFMTILPLSVASFYPASALLGYSLEGALITAISTIILLIVSLKVWYWALSKYSSAGG